MRGVIRLAQGRYVKGSMGATQESGQGESRGGRFLETNRPKGMQIRRPSQWKGSPTAGKDQLKRERKGTQRTPKKAAPT